MLKNYGYFIEVAESSLDFIDLQLYSVILLIDTEKGLSNSEIENLKFNYENNNLSVFIISEWNNADIIKYISASLNIDEKKDKIFNGSELNSLNLFLRNYGFEIGEDSLSYEFFFNKKYLKVFFFIKTKFFSDKIRKFY